MVQAMPKDGRWTAEVVADWLRSTGQHNYLCGFFPTLGELFSGHCCEACKSINAGLLDADLEAYGEPNEV